MRDPMRSRAIEHRWQIDRLGRRGGAPIGIVYARNEMGARDRAIEQFRITDLQLQKQLVVRRTD